MSFILEALKKSEQQRQQNESTTQKVRKRTLSMQSQKSGRRNLYLLLTAILSLIVFGTWLFYDNSKTTPAEVTALDQPMSTAETLNPPAAPNVTRESTTPTTAPQQTVEKVPPQEEIHAQAAMATHTPEKVTKQPVEATSLPVKTTESPAKTDNLEKTVVQTEPAPVPSVYIEAPVPTRETTPVMKEKSATEVQRQGFVDAEPLPVNEQVSTVNIEQPQEPISGGISRYQDLSEELRSRMPVINMSMHFYNKIPERRLVRINDLLLHEGDWVDRNLQLVEITGSGVTLDFLGKAFILPRARR